MKSLLKCYTSDYANFHGRAGRMTFWTFVLSYVVLSYLMYYLDNMLGMPTLTHLTLHASGSVHSVGSHTMATTHVLNLGALSVGFWLLTLIPMLSAYARRLHDTGHSFAWFFIALVPIVGAIYLLFLLLKRGDLISNQYGDVA